MMSRLVYGFIGAAKFSIHSLINLITSPIISFGYMLILSYGIAYYDTARENPIKKLLKMTGLTILFTPVHILLSLPIRAIEVICSPFWGLYSGFESNSFISYESPISSYLDGVLEQFFMYFVWKFIDYKGDFDLTSYFQLAEYITAFQAAELNVEESTHTASVHKTVSTSATNLMNRYAESISKRGIDNLINDINASVTSLSDLTVKESAAKRCMSHLSYSDFDSDYEDPVSKVSTKQLLALFWLVIHDDNMRIGLKEDAYSGLIEALYEIQRGGNFNAYDVDDRLNDSPICPAGKFNKLMEKLQSIHPDVEVLYMTKFSANMKLPRVVTREVYNYIKNLPTPFCEAEIQQRNRLIDSLIVEGITDEIWTQVSAPVANAMFEEFGCLFNNKREGQLFSEYIAAGQYTTLKEKDFNRLRPVPEAIVYPRLFQSVYSSTAPSNDSLDEPNISNADALSVSLKPVTL